MPDFTQHRDVGDESAPTRQPAGPPPPDFVTPIDIIRGLYAECDILRAAAVTLRSERDDYRERFNYEAERAARLEAAGTELEQLVRLGITWLPGEASQDSAQARRWSAALAAWRATVEGASHE